MKNLIITENQKNEILLLHRLIIEDGGSKPGVKWIVTVGLEDTYKFIDNMLFRNADGEMSASVRNDLKQKAGNKDVIKELETLAIKRGDNLKTFIDATLKKIQDPNIKLVDKTEIALRDLLVKMEKGYGNRLTKDEIQKFTQKQIDDSANSILNKKIPGETKTFQDNTIDLASDLIKKNAEDGVKITETKLELSLKENIAILYKRKVGEEIPKEVLETTMSKIKNSDNYKKTLEGLKNYFDVDVKKSLDEINKEIDNSGLPLSKVKAEISRTTKVQYFLKKLAMNDSWITYIFAFIRLDKWVEINQLYLKQIIQSRNLRGAVDVEEELHKKLTKMREILNAMAKTKFLKGGEKAIQKERELYYLELEKEIKTLRDYKRINDEGEVGLDKRINEIYNLFEQALRKSKNEDPDDNTGAVSLYDWFTERGTNNLTKLNTLEETFETVINARKSKSDTNAWEDALSILYKWKTTYKQENLRGWSDDPEIINKTYENVEKNMEIIFGKAEVSKGFFSTRPGRIISTLLSTLLNLITGGIGQILKYAGNMIVNFARNGVFTSPQFMEKMFFKHGYPKGALILIARWIIIYSVVLPVLRWIRDNLYMLAEAIINKLPNKPDGLNASNVGTWSAYILKVILQTILYCFSIGPIDGIGQWFGVPEAQKELAEFQDDLDEFRSGVVNSLLKDMQNGLVSVVGKVFGTLLSPTPILEYILKILVGAKVGVTYLFTGKLSKTDIELLQQDIAFLSAPAPEIVSETIFDFVKFYAKAKNDTTDLFQLNNIDQELKRLQNEIINKSNAKVEAALDETNKTLLSERMDNAKKKIKEYVIGPDYVGPDLITESEYKLLTEKGFLTYNPNYLKNITGDDEVKNAEAQYSIRQMVKNSNFNTIDENTAPIGILVDKIFYPYIVDYGIANDYSGSRLAYGNNYYAPHFWDPVNKKIVSLKYMAVHYLMSNSAKVQESLNQTLKTDDLFNDLTSVTNELNKDIQNYRNIVGYKDKKGTVDMWYSYLIQNSYQGQGRMPKLGFNKYKFELALKNYNEAKTKGLEKLKRIGERMTIVNSYIEKFTIWANSLSNLNRKKDLALLKSYVSTLDEYEIPNEEYEKEVPSGKELTDATGKVTEVLHKIKIIKMVPPENKFIGENTIVKKNIINERYLLGNRNMRSRYIFENEDEQRFGENKFDHWYDTFTFQKYDEKSGDFKDIETDSLKHGKIKERFNDFIKNYDGDDAFVRAVVDTHPEVSRFKYLKDQANIQEVYYPTGLASILSVIRESKGEYEIFSVSRQKGGNWNLVKGDFTQKEMSNMVLTKQIPPEKKPKERENGLESLKKKEATGTNSLRNDEKEGLKNLPKKVKEKVQEKISRGWTTEIPPKVFKDFYEESEISSVFNEKIPIYKLEATPEFFRSLQKNSSHVLVRRGFCRSLLMAKNDSDINSEQRKVVNHILSKCEDKFEGKLGLRYLSKKS